MINILFFNDGESILLEEGGTPFLAHPLITHYYGSMAALCGPFARTCLCLSLCSYSAVVLSTSYPTHVYPRKSPVTCSGGGGVGELRKGVCEGNGDGMGWDF